MSKAQKTWSCNKYMQKLDNINIHNRFWLSHCQPKLAIYLRFSFPSRVREKTYQRLQQLSGGVLSQVLQKLTRHDPISPLLTPPHYKALDRRLKHIFVAIDRCIEENGRANVFVDDSYIYSKGVR